MASPSTVTCSGSISSLRKYPSGSDQENKKDQRKWKRMLSNRESARRSRMRKQKHLDDLLLQVADQLRAENFKIITNMKIVIQLYLNVKSQNEVLRAQMCEMNHRLWALNDTVNCIKSNRINTYTHTDTPPLVWKILVMIITLIFIITCLMGLMIRWNPWSLNIIHANYKPIWATDRGDDDEFQASCIF